MDELRKILESSEDHFAILNDIDLIAQYNLNVQDYMNLANEFLSDAERFNLLSNPRITSNKVLASSIIGSVHDTEYTSRIFENTDLLDTLSNYQLVSFIKGASDEVKLSVINDSDFVHKHQINNCYVVDFILSLSDENKVSVLNNVDMLRESFQIPNYTLRDIIKTLSDADSKLRLCKKCDLSTSDQVSVICEIDDDKKSDVLLGEHSFDKYNVTDIMASMNVDALVRFLSEHEAILKEFDIMPSKLVSSLSPEKQLEFLSHIEEFSFSLNEKREIFALLDNSLKVDLDASKFAPEYASALQLVNNYGLSINIDFSLDMARYAGLDRLLNISGDYLSDTERNKLLELCDICPNMCIRSSFTKNDQVFYTSSAKEYKEGEAWISSVLEQIPANASAVQKLAIIDHAIGKKISYSPDYGTEMFDNDAARAMWKTVTNGYGVCNGIARIENYILSRVGIESELVDGPHHTFVRLKDIELPTADGGSVRGDTLCDPTWNLASHRFDARPNNFCLSYEDIRKNDIDDAGRDHESHKNDEALSDVTLSIDDKAMREVFLSVGLLRDDMIFPVKAFMDRSDEIDAKFASSPAENISAQLDLFSKVCPEFATCQESTMTMLAGISLNKPNMRLKKKVVNRVFDKSDPEKKPVTFVYVSSMDFGKKFFVADASVGKFVEFSEEKFLERYDCYQKDLEKSDGARPWEDVPEKKKDTDLNQSSGKIVAEKEER